MIQAAFEKLVGEIGVSQAQRSQGSVSHQHVRRLLDNKWKADPSFPWLIDGDFISGSYARGTKIHPLDDIDIMVVIDGTGLHAIDRGQRLNAQVRGDGAQGNPVGNLTYEPGGLISSKLVLEVFRSAIKESYPNSEIKKHGQAVNVWLESYGMGIDIVPCFHIIPNNGGRDFYYIPKGGDSHEWIATNPKIDQEICDATDLQHDNKLKAVIKLLKYWNRIHNASRLQSYHLETVALNIFRNHPAQIEDHHGALEYFFNNAIPYFVIECADMTGLGEPVDGYLSSESRRLTIVKLTEVQQMINSHSFLASVMPANIISGWRKILGNSFGT